ncbi:MAG TPA: GHKL domain-containing protein [Candidatus Gallacutalibacter stercoravium]|nr:GHKL domain-containing protein [Candidatus Gallacutalibacter stercoravium]
MSFFSNVLSRLLAPLLDKRLAAFQNDQIAAHCAEVENIYRQMRGWRHDYHNHIQTMKAHLALGQTDELNQYLSTLDTDLNEIDTMLKTGNVMVDAILNSKLSLAKSQGIRTDATAYVPSQLAVTEVDLCVILGNLLDNAIEACQLIEEKKQRFIRVYLGMLKQQLYISVSNSARGQIRRAGKRYLSTKDAPSHGYGLARVDRIVERYGGFVRRAHEEGVFATEIMLPIAQETPGGQK